MQHEKNQLSIPGANMAGHCGKVRDVRNAGHISLACHFQSHQRRIMELEAEEVGSWRSGVEGDSKFGFWPLAITGRAWV